ncbi:MAG: ABC transporter ATP-binding protein, partial [Chloroflexota bacterium]
MGYLLSIEKLTIEGWSGETWSILLDHIDLHLDHGEVLGLIGESGAGKSTLGLACLGYIRPGCRITSGSIVFNGMELTTAPNEELRILRGNRITYVAQSAAASFNPAHKILYQTTEGLVHHRLMNFEESKKKAVALYQRLNLPDPERIGYRYPHQLSGGQLQRSMVAMAMASDPEIAVFDEPTTALDVTTQIEVMLAIKEAIRDRNTAAIYITHDLAVVSQLADRIMVLRHGRLIEEGSTRNLLRNPKEKYTRDLLNVRSWCKEETAPSENVVLEVSGVSAGYIPKCNVVENVTFQVKRGRTVAVVGESGSGKTTLARVIIGLLPPGEGNIIFDGKLLPPSVKHRNRDCLRRMQMIYQMPDVALNPRQKVGKI